MTHLKLATTQPVETPAQKEHTAGTYGVSAMAVDDAYPVPELDQILETIGLNSSEIAVYKTALQAGPRPASVIAKRANIKRGQTYNVLSSLSEKGVIQEFVKNGVRHFTCSSPRALVSMLDSRRGEIENKRSKLLELIPDLERLARCDDAKPKVRFFQGDEGIKEIFEDILRTREDFYGALDVGKSWINAYSNDDWIHKFRERRVEAGIWFYGILVKNHEADMTRLSRPKIMKKNKMIQGVSLPAEILVFGSKVALISTDGDKTGVLIEHAKIAETVRSIHQAVWPFLPDYE